MSRLIRVYSAALRLCPRAFRDQFGADMVANVRDQLASEPGAARRLRCFASAMSDLLRTAAAEWIELLGASRSAPNVARTIQMHSIAQDLGFAARSLRRRPLFVTAVIATLALGIGANTAVFSLIDAVLLHPLPVSNPTELVAIHEALNTHEAHGQTAYPAFRVMAARSRAFSGIAGFYTIDVGARSSATIDQLTAAAVSGNYFQLLGVKPLAGRLISAADDDAVGAHPVVVLSDAMWESAFHRRADAIGSVIHIGETAFTVIGVTPSNFHGTELDKSPRLWVPITMITTLGAGSLFSGAHSSFVFTTHNFGWVHMVGRLRAPATGAQATAELNAILDDLGRESPGARRALQANVKAPMNVVPVVQAAALSDRESLVRFVTMVLVVVALTLLIACVNVANLMHVRSTERAKELGIRAALGAGRGRIMRQLLLESLLLGVGGALTGCLVGAAAMRLLSRFTLPGGVALAAIDMGLDRRVLAFTGALGVLTALLFGLAPSIRASRVSLAGMLKAHGTSTRRSSRGILVAAQVAMSLVLLVGAALFARSLKAGLETDIGFDPGPLAAVSFDPRLVGYDKPRAHQLFDDAIARARLLPGVSAAAVATHVPLGNMLQLGFSAADDDAQSSNGPPAPSIVAGLTSISPDYFHVLGVPIVQGRGFTEADDGVNGKVAILNEAAANAFFKNQPAVGGKVHLLGMTYTIVGMVRDTKYESVRDGHVPVVFAPIKEEGDLGGLTMVVRGTDRAAALSGIREIFHTIAPTIPLHDGRFVADQIDAVLMPQRFGATLFGIFSLVALCVSAAGIFGVIAFGVAQRSAEIGIRIALGAQSADVLGLVLRRVTVAAVAGIVIGATTAAAAGRTLQQFLFGVTSFDLPAFVVATSVLAVVAGFAAWVPARRAVRIDPMIAMRAE